jgi:hypothetical protein
MKEPLRISGKALIRDYLMAYRIRQLPTVMLKPEIWYHGASDIKTWTGGELEHFEEGIRDAVMRGIEVRRLFVFEKPLDEPSQVGAPVVDDCTEKKQGVSNDAKERTGGSQSQVELADTIVDILRRHAEITKGNTGYQWRTILKSALPETIRDEVPFALFRDGKNVDVEVAQGDDRFGFGATKSRTVLLEQGFNSAWSQVIELESMKVVLGNHADEIIASMKHLMTPHAHQDPSPDDQKSKGNSVREQRR